MCYFMYGQDRYTSPLFLSKGSPQKFLVISVARFTSFEVITAGRMSALFRLVDSITQYMYPLSEFRSSGEIVW